MRLAGLWIWTHQPALNLAGVRTHCEPCNTHGHGSRGRTCKCHRVACFDDVKILKWGGCDM